MDIIIWKIIFISIKKKLDRLHLYVILKIKNLFIHSPYNFKIIKTFFSLFYLYTGLFLLFLFSNLFFFFLITNFMVMFGYRNILRKKIVKKKYFLYVVVTGCIFFYVFFHLHWNFSSFFASKFFLIAFKLL